jgi:hypothetical protein
MSVTCSPQVCFVGCSRNWCGRFLWCGDDAADSFGAVMTPVGKSWYFVTWFRSQPKRWARDDEERFLRLYIENKLAFTFKRSFEWWLKSQK